MAQVGRFAPSPTGELHLGTLTAAVASFVHARQADGEWLVRIEDIDPPREVPGSADSILRTLEALEMCWDREVLYQHTRLDAYGEIVRGLLASGDAFRCSCSRQQIRAASGGRRRYPGTCRQRQHHSSDTAVRLRVDDGVVGFDDHLQGLITRDIAATDGDFIITRRDGLPAYHLAVVLDDAFQGITDIVRGVDLLDCTPLHVYLQDRLSLPHPAYRHIPLVTNSAGQKLSKGSGASAVDIETPGRAAALALRALGARPPGTLAGAPPAELWRWAIENWQIATLAGKRTITAVDV